MIVDANFNVVSQQNASCFKSSSIFVFAFNKNDNQSGNYHNRNLDKSAIDNKDARTDGFFDEDQDNKYKEIIQQSTDKIKSNYGNCV